MTTHERGMITNNHITKGHDCHDCVPNPAPRCEGPSGGEPVTDPELEKIAVLLLAALQSHGRW